MKIRLWLIEHSLSPAEEQRLRELRSAGRDGNRGPDKITYRKKRVVKDVEAESIIDANTAAFWDGREVIDDLSPGLSQTMRRFVTIFAAAPAEDGEKCSQIENAWSAEEQELPLT